MNSQTKQIEVLDLKTDHDGRIAGYGSVFGNEDNGGDIVAPGAFRESLKARTPRMLWQHNPSEVVGVWDSVREDGKGLRVEGRVFAETVKGKEALVLLRNKAIDGLSIGYKTEKTGFKGNARVIEKAQLWEISLVTFPMNAAATVDAVKGLTSQRDVEELLRKTGLPWGACKKIASGGWPALRGNQITETEGKSLAEQMRRITAQLRHEHGAEHGT